MSLPSIIARSSALLLVLVACSSSSNNDTKAANVPDSGTTTTTPGPDTTTPVATQSLEGAYATALCGFLQRCTASTVASKFGDQNGCITKKSAGAKPSLHADSAGDLTTQMSACVAALAAHACDGEYDTFPPAGCAFVGALANGAACTYGTQCQSGACTGGALATDCGKCAPVAAVGADCGANVSCASGALCGNDGKCVALGKAVGDACGPGCREGLVCNEDTEKCEKISQAGEDCSVSETCADGYSCADKKTCTANPIAAVGGKCGYNVDTGVQTDCTNGFCVGGDNAVDGTCTAFVQLGGACSDEFATPAFCDDGLACVDGKCVVDSRPVTCK